MKARVSLQRTHWAQPSFRLSVKKSKTRTDCDAGLRVAHIEQRFVGARRDRRAGSLACQRSEQSQRATRSVTRRTSVTESIVLILPTVNAMTGGLAASINDGFNSSVAVWVGYIALFAIAVETGAVIVIYLHEALNRHSAAGELTHEGVEAAVIEGALQRLRPKLMTVPVVMLSLAQILWESGIGSDVMKPIAAPIVGGMIISKIHVLILVPVFFATIKEWALRANYARQN